MNCSLDTILNHMDGWMIVFEESLSVSIDMSFPTIFKDVGSACSERELRLFPTDTVMDLVQMRICERFRCFSDLMCQKQHGHLFNIFTDDEVFV